MTDGNSVKRAGAARRKQVLGWVVGLTVAAGAVQAWFVFGLKVSPEEMKHSTLALVVWLAGTLLAYTPSILLGFNRFSVVWGAIPPGLNGTLYQLLALVKLSQKTPLADLTAGTFVRVALCQVAISGAAGCLVAILARMAEKVSSKGESAVE